MTRFRAAILPTIVALSWGCAGDPPTGSEPRFAQTGGESKTFVVQARSATSSTALSDAIAAAGGTITASLDGIGVVVATSADPQFAAIAASVPGVNSVTEDRMITFAMPTIAEATVEADVSGVEGQAHEFGGHESFRLVQWAPDAISAPAAWATGARGAGARVAIIDGGIHSTHIDIAPNLDVARSASFVPGQTFNSDVGNFWHGTHVAGIVAAPANNLGTVGIAPEATIIGVKALHNGSGAFSWIIQAIYYAATPIAEGGAGAHIINMSLGAGIDGRGREIAALLNSLSRATSYARQRGTLVIAAAGNSAVDLDHSKNLVFVPAQSVGVLAIAATAPIGWALGATNFDQPTSYTNFGQSAISFAGPGGDNALPGNAFCSRPVLPAGTVTVPCWVFDLVLAPVRGSGVSNYGWAAGTSMASPAVAGVAALIVGKYGPMAPAQLAAKLGQSADDLGKPGQDDYYGRGRVNALRAVQ